MYNSLQLLLKLTQGITKIKATSPTGHKEQNIP